jgi:protein dithiol:quinone oxidoreductase
MRSTMRSSGRTGGIQIGRRKLALAGFLTCTGLILFALYLQYVKGLDPCPLCMIQRVFFIALGFVFLVAAIAGPQRLFARLYGVLATLLAAAGVGFAARHVWLQWHPPELESCTADLFVQLQRLPFASVIERALYATGDCAKVDWTLLGLSVAQWSFIWFVILLVLSLIYLTRRPRLRTDWP